MQVDPFDLIIVKLALKPTKCGVKASSFISVHSHKELACTL